MDFIKIFYNGLPAKVYKLLSSIPNNIESDVERFSYIHNLLSVDLGIIGRQSNEKNHEIYGKIIF